MTSVIVVGPPAFHVGGMAAVTQQMRALDWPDRFCVEFFPTTHAPAPGEAKLRRLARHITQLRSLGELLAARGPAIVHLHTCSGFSFFRSAADLYVAKRAARPVVLHVHGAGFDEFHRSAGPLRRRFIARALTGADAVIALSEGWRGKLLSIAPRATVEALENAVDLPPAARTHEHSGPCRFLMLARMDRWKGVDDLLAACANLRATEVAFELVLAGPEGSAGGGEALAAKIHELGIETCARYVGAVGGEAKEDWLNWADVLVQPSHQEGMPLAMLEAMARGVPIVATSVGAVPEIITPGEHGLLTPPGDPALLARTMRAMASDAASRQAMGRSARALAEMRFSTRRFRDGLVALYDKVLATQHAPRATPLLQPTPCRRADPTASAIG
ncbi:MAG: glycosyltransferase family 4 protein [Planctomycetes bacterium]|nr:glycosyltransferase family 4 protein [Planctomycetota bacterium]